MRASDDDGIYDMARNGVGHDITPPLAQIIGDLDLGTRRKMRHSITRVPTHM